MKLSAHDLHFLFSRTTNRLKAFDAKGRQLLDVECRNRTVRDGQLGHWGNCPPGCFLLDEPRPKNAAAFGTWFVGLKDWEECRAMAAYRRSGIGLHGGGSGLPNPFAPRQSPPFIPTHGCLRTANIDLAEVVHLIRGSQGVGGQCYITVEKPVPGMMNDALDDYLDVPEEQLAPDE